MSKNTNTSGENFTNNPTSEQSDTSNNYTENKKKESTTDVPNEPIVDFSKELADLALNLTNLNIIKDELAVLPLNPSAVKYFNNTVNPLLSVLVGLSTASFNLSSSTSYLALSRITSSKDSKIKDTEKLVYALNEQSDDVYNVLKKTINCLLDLSKS